MIFNRFQRAFHRFGGGTFGCTAVHAQMTIVERQLQIIPNNVRRITDFGSSDVFGIILSMTIGIASTLPQLRRMGMRMWRNMGGN
jgi:hypothetical protein